MNEPVIVSIGETLWDVFPDGPRLGGAPLNFSCCLAELAPAGTQVHMVSAVGDDELGQKAIEAVARHGVHTAQMRTNVRPTGQVLVELDPAGVASYRFAENSAWDHLSWNALLQQLAANCDTVCFGTLGQRSDLSRDTIQRFVAETSSETLRILDVNLRAPFFDDELIRESLDLANVLKLNDDELPVLAKLSGVQGSDIDVMQQLADRYQLACVALTRGADGAILVSGDDVSDLPGLTVEVVDTVGAGDAFTAAMVLGLLSGRKIDDVNTAAIKTASYVCSQPGATMSFPEHLRKAC